MPKTKITLSAEDSFKEYVATIGEWYLSRGVDVEDKQNGGISLSATLAQLVQEKLEAIQDEDDDNTPVEELIELYPECAVNGQFDYAKYQILIEDGFRQGWHEAMTEQIRSIEDVLAELDED